MCHLNSFSALLCSLFLSMSETEDNFKYHLPTGLAGAIFLLLSWARYLLYKFMYYIQMLMFLIFNKCKLKNDLIIRCNISQRINRCYVFSKKKSNSTFCIMRYYFFNRTLYLFIFSKSSI